MPSGADLEYARLLAAARIQQPDIQGYDGARLEQLSDEREVLLDLLTTGIIISLDTDGVPYIGTIQDDVGTAVPVKIDTDGVFYFLMGP